MADKSTDGSGVVARTNGARVVREERRGYGRACLTGLDVLLDAPEPADVNVFLG